MKIIMSGLLLLCAAVGLAQNGPQQGGSEIQVWAGGGHSIPGGTSNTGVFSAGFRYGWILTGPHGPGFLRGQFEYAADAVPVILIFQPANTAYGVGLNPVGLKWDFVRRGPIVPYFELGGGMLFSTHRVPAGTSGTNFTSQAAVGLHYLAKRVTWSLDARFLHISNAGLTSFNPGINTFQVRLGIGTFQRP